MRIADAVAAKYLLNSFAGIANHSTADAFFIVDPFKCRIKD
jgi:hypothetical protein